MAAREGGNQTGDELEGRILTFLGEGPAHFEDILLRFPDVSYREILRAWGRLREKGLLGRELSTGMYVRSAGGDQGRKAEK